MLSSPPIPDPARPCWRMQLWARSGPASCRPHTFVVSSVTFLCMMLSACTWELWADDNATWPIERDGPSTIRDVFVDDRHVTHALVRTAAGNVAYLLRENSTPYSVTWLSADDWGYVEEKDCAEWHRESRVPIGVCDTAGEVSGGREDSMIMRISLDPVRHGVINGTITIYRYPGSGPSRYFLPLLPIRWVSLSAVGHVLATPVTAVVDVVLSPAYLVIGGLEAVGLIHSHP